MMVLLLTSVLFLRVLFPSAGLLHRQTCRIPVVRLYNSLVSTTVICNNCYRTLSHTQRSYHSVRPLSLTVTGSYTVDRRLKYMRKMNLRSTANSNDDVEEKPPLRTRDIVIPLDAINLSFTRSSGAGGQNVNKVNTKVEIRFHVDSASWIPADWKDRLKQQQGNKINKEGELVVSSQEHRTQAKNREDCLEKIRVMIVDASVAPKERNMWVEIGEKGKEIRKKEKMKKKEVKSNRRDAKNSSKFFD